MKNIVNGQIINIQGFKHDGTLYRQWSGAKVIEVSPELITVFMYKTKVLELSGQKWIIREPILWWFPIDDFFNTTGLIRKQGTFFYTNIASPPIFEDNTIKFIDYDLDVKSYPGQNVKIVDKNEFYEHTYKYKYDEKLIKKIEKTTEQVTKYISHNEGFFDEEVIDTYIQELIDTKQLAQKFESMKKN